MAEDWSSEEVAATVADYFAMLALELRSEPYNKREHNRRLQSLLRGRSAGAIEPIDVIAGSLPTRQRRLVEAWAELHQQELRDDWNRLQQGQLPKPIEPLA